MAGIVGLTGGIASGKSTVAAMFAELGGAVVDADAIAHHITAPDHPTLTLIARRFGGEVIGGDGQLDRKRLGAIVFADSAARRDLEAITHPYIRAASQLEIATHIARGREVVFYEAALIVEKRLHEAPWMHALVVVASAPDQQIARIVARDQLSEDEARARVDAQATLAAKLAAADYVVENSASVAETRAQVVDIWQRIRATI